MSHILASNRVWSEPLKKMFEYRVSSFLLVYQYWRLMMMVTDLVPVVVVVAVVVVERRDIS